MIILTPKYKTGETWEMSIKKFSKKIDTEKVSALKIAEALVGAGEITKIASGKIYFRKS